MASETTEVNPRVLRSAIICFVLVILGLTIIFGSWYTVDQTQRAVLLRNGAFVSVENPGLHFKLPWFERAQKIDLQTHTMTYDKVNSHSADQQPADLKISVTFHAAPDKLEEMYARFGGDLDAAVRRLITPHMTQEVKVVFGRYTAASAISDRGQLNTDIASAMTTAVAYDPVLVIEGVQVEDIEFSPDYIRSVEARMQAEVAVQQRKQELAQEKINAENALTQATGQANSVRTEAQAQADAIKLKGEAEADAIKARAAALGNNPEIVALTQAEKWNGQLPYTMLPNAGVPFLTLGQKP